MYCGAELPAEAAAAARELPEDLDELVAKALGKGGKLAMARLQDKLKGSKRTATANKAPSTPPVSGGRGFATAPAGADLPPRKATPTNASASGTAPSDASPSDAESGPDTTIDGLDALLSAARTALDTNDRAAASAALRKLSAQAAALADTLPASTSPPPPPAVELPPLRKPFMLVVEGLGDGSRGVDLAGPLGVDVATARQVALARHARVALRASERVRLDARATAIGAAGIACCVVPRAAIEALPPATLLLALTEPVSGPARSPWVVTSTPHWQAASAPDAQTLYQGAVERDAGPVLLAVPGEVLLRRHAQARDLGYRTHKRHQAARDLGETRVPVLDLHGPGVHLRLLPGMTSPVGWPGADERSSLRAFRALIDGLPATFPGVFVEGARACSPPRSLPMQRDAAGKDRQVHTLSGWPTWEEHTRICRILHRVDG